jgi:membrane associated rhomboid family serine protease/Tfp pilus assembly protein PilF
LANCPQCGLTLAGDEPVNELCPQCRRLWAKTGDPRPQFPLLTWLLISINVALFCVTAALSFSFWSISSGFLAAFGGNYGPLTLSGQWVRLVTSLFLHAGFAHLFFNMWALYVLGKMAERIWYRREFLALYLVSGIAGSLAALWDLPLGVTIGASGAIFGILGALVSALLFRSVPLKGTGFRQLFSMLAFVGYSFYSSIGSRGVSTASHIGGVLAGFVLGAFLTIRKPATRWDMTFEASPIRNRSIAVAAIAICVLGALSVSLEVSEEYVLQVGAARRFEAAKQYDAAIEQLKKVLEVKPEVAEVHYELGIAYKEKSMNDEAIDSFKHVLKLNPNDSDIYADLGEVQYRAHYYDDAIGSFQKLTAAHPDSPVSHYNLGLVYLMKDDYDPAIREFNSALELKKDFTEARTGLDLALKNRDHSSTKPTPAS